MKRLKLVWSAVAIIISTGGCSMKNEDFKSARIELSSSFEVAKPASEVFPLYGAEEEKKWAPDWNPDWLYPDNETAKNAMPQKDWIFKVGGGHGHGDPQIWTVREYDPQKLYVEYYAVNPGITAYSIKVRVSSNSSTSSTTKVTYLFTSLSEKGNKVVNSKNQETFKKEIEVWEKFIDYYFKTGKTHPPLKSGH